MTALPLGPRMELAPDPTGRERFTYVHVAADGTRTPMTRDDAVLLMARLNQDAAIWGSAR